MIFLITFVCSIIHSGYSANFEALDAKVEAYIGPEGPSQLLRPAYAPVALRVLHNQKGGSQTVGQLSERWSGIGPHPRFASSRFMGEEFFPKTPGCALTTFFFPNEDGLIPNTISRDDPVGKLNQGRNDQTLWAKMSGRLGDIVATVHEMLLVGPDAFDADAAARQLMLAFDQKHADVFDCISPDLFAQYELLVGLQQAFERLYDAVRGLSPSDASRAVAELSDSGLKALMTRALAGEKLTIRDLWVIPQVVAHYSGVVSDDVVSAFVMSDGKELNGLKVKDKKLMALRKRHLASLLAETIADDLRTGTLYPVSLSTLMSYVWKTRGEGSGLDVFYSHALRNPQLQLADMLQPTSASDLMKVLTTVKAMEHPTMAGMSFARQMALLELDRGVQDIQLPGSGMATAGGLNYSVCVESMILDALIHACRHPLTKNFAFDTLPEGPGRDYFKAHGHDLFSQAARNAWAELTRQVPNIVRVDGGRGLEPSFRNVMLMYQFLMGGKQFDVQPVRTQEAYERAVGRYKEFLNTFSTWLTQNLGWDVMFLMDDYRWADGRRIVGSINVNTKVEGCDMPLGTLFVDPGHGHYEVDSFLAHRQQSEEQRLMNRLPVEEFRPPYVAYLTSPQTIGALALAVQEDMLPHLDILPHVPYLIQQMFVGFMQNPTPEKVRYFRGLASKIQRSNHHHEVLIDGFDVVNAVKNEESSARPLRTQLLDHVIEEAPHAFDSLTISSEFAMTLLEMGDALGLRQKMQTKALPHVRWLSLQDMCSPHDSSLRWATVLPHMAQLEHISFFRILEKMQGADDQAAVDADLLALQGVSSLKEIDLFDTPKQLVSDAFKILISFMPENITLGVRVDETAGETDLEEATDHKALGQHIRTFLQQTRPDIKLTLGDSLGDNESGVITDRPTEADLMAAGNV